MSYWDTDKADKEVLLVTSWNAGHSAREIVAALMQRFGGKVTRNAVLGKVNRLRLEMHRPGCRAPDRKPSHRLISKDAW